MRAEDFAAWLAAISGMSEGQRSEAKAALETASMVRGAAGASAKKGGKRSRQRDALGTTGVERVAAQGCPHCAGREVVGWGRSHGLLRFRCKSCGRTFNALTKTPMAHLRKKEKWLDHARAMIEGKSLAKTAALCGVHPTTAFRWRHRFLRAPASDKPRGLRGIVEADETFILESFKGRWSDLPRKARKRGGRARHAGLYQDNIPILVARDRNGATFDAILASGRRRFGEPRPRWRRYAGQSSHRRWREGDRHFRPQSRDSVPRRAGAGKADPRGAAPAHQQRQRLPRPSQAVAQPLQRRRHQEPAQLSRLAACARSLGR
jgi:transposase-like protein